jgi:hypothetical protein
MCQARLTEISPESKKRMQKRRQKNKNKNKLKSSNKKKTKRLNISLDRPTRGSNSQPWAIIFTTRESI